MKVLVCGGRAYKDAVRIREVLSAFHAAQPIARLIEGGATGADRLAREWAITNRVPFKEVAADWVRFGKSAGPMRNKTMLREGEPDVVIAFPGGAGTAHMVKIAREAGVEVLVIKEMPDKPHGDASRAGNSTPLVNSNDVAVEPEGGAPT